MSASELSKRVELHGIGVSPGVATGPAFLASTVDERPVERDIQPDEVPREIARYEEALMATREQLRDIQRQLGPESAGILEAHLMLVDDRAIVEDVIRSLSLHKKNVEAVLRVIADRFIQTLSSVDDAYLRERAADVRDVTRRVLRNLTGASADSLINVDSPCILVANDIAPSEAATLNREKMLGFVTDLGSPTSHTAIMARAFNMPAVVGLHDISVRVSRGDSMLIDGNKGTVIIRPTQEDLESYGKIEASRRTIQTTLDALREEPSETLDGYHVSLSANIEMASDVDRVLACGADGVGLFRTEYLYLKQQGLPSEDEQVAAYEQIARRLAPARAVIRTLDLGGDKFLSQIKMPQEVNPFMGWRAIRFCLAQPEIFKTQLRAILRASCAGNIKLMYPMISSLDEVLKANMLLDECKDELRAKHIPFDEDMDVGIMIEIPSAALTAHLLAPHVDFFSLGTNDLVQYTLAVDRVNERIAYLYQPTHPAIIRLIKNTVDVGHQHGIWTGVCGEMAGNPLMVPLLIGLGVDEFSVSTSLVPMIKEVVRKLSYSQAEELATTVLALESAYEITETCRNLVRRITPEILELLA